MNEGTLLEAKEIKLPQKVIYFRGVIKIPTHCCEPLETVC